MSRPVRPSADQYSIKIEFAAHPRLEDGPFLLSGLDLMADDYIKQAAGHAARRPDNVCPSPPLIHTPLPLPRRISTTSAVDA